MHSREGSGFHFSLGGWLISFFQGADGGGQSLRKGRSQGKGEKKEWDLWPSGSSFYVVLPFPILEVHDTLRNDRGTQSSDLHAKAKLNSPAIALLQRHTQSPSWILSAASRYFVLSRHRIQVFTGWWDRPPKATHVLLRVVDDGAHRGIISTMGLFPYSLCSQPSALRTWKPLPLSPKNTKLIGVSQRAPAWSHNPEIIIEDL